MKRALTALLSPSSAPLHLGPPSASSLLLHHLLFPACQVLPHPSASVVPLGPPQVQPSTSQPCPHSSSHRKHPSLAYPGPGNSTLGILSAERFAHTESCVFSAVLFMTVNTSEIVKNGNNPKGDWINNGIFIHEFCAATKKISLC